DIRWYLPEYWLERFNLDEDPMELFKSHVDKLRFYPEVRSVLGKLSQRYDLTIASSAPKNIIAIMTEKLQRYFKYIYSPVSDFNEVKKTPHFYKLICEAMEIKPCFMLHIGDEWDCDYISPRKIGAKSLYLCRSGEKRGKSVIRDLNELEDHLANSTLE
ncbi:MAG: HAD family hydrolase, partial [Candidatus Bathyarchaeota archaeon]